MKSRSIRQRFINQASSIGQVVSMIRTVERNNEVLDVHLSVHRRCEARLGAIRIDVDSLCGCM